MYCFLSFLFTVMSITVKHSGLYISCCAGAVQIESSKAKKKAKNSQIRQSAVGEFLN